MGLNGWLARKRTVAAVVDLRGWEALCCVVVVLDERITVSLLERNWFIGVSDGVEMAVGGNPASTVEKSQRNGGEVEALGFSSPKVWSTRGSYQYECDEVCFKSVGADLGTEGGSGGGGRQASTLLIAPVHARLGLNELFE